MTRSGIEPRPPAPRADSLTTMLRRGGHKKPVAVGNGSSALSEHRLDSSRHHIDWDSTRIIDWETQYFPRKVREAIHIRRQRLEMNRDGGLELPHIYDRVLIAAPPNSQSEEVHSREWTKVSQYY